MQRVIKDENEYLSVLDGYEEEGFFVDRSLEGLSFPGIFFIVKRDCSICMGQLDMEKMSLLQRMYDDFWD